MGKYTEEELENLVEQWHTNPNITLSLREFLNMSEEEFRSFAIGTYQYKEDVEQEI